MGLPPFVGGKRGDRRQVYRGRRRRHYLNCRLLPSAAATLAVEPGRPHHGLQSRPATADRLSSAMSVPPGTCCPTTGLTTLRVELRPPLIRCRSAPSILR